MANGDTLMARARAGDADAFETLVAVYWPVAERVARGLLGDAQLAQDVAQEVFADIYMQRERYTPRFFDDDSDAENQGRDTDSGRNPDPFHTYVAAIARHKSIDALRKRGRVPAEWAEADARDARTPESALIDRMFHGALYAAVEHLPEAQRRMLTAYALEGRSYREIAEELHLSVAQVKITLHRIRKGLRRVRDDWDA